MSTFGRGTLTNDMLTICCDSASAVGGSGLVFRLRMGTTAPHNISNQSGEHEMVGFVREYEMDEASKLERSIRQMREALELIRAEAATKPNGGAWAGGIATLCLGTLRS